MTTDPYVDLIIPEDVDETPSVSASWARVDLGVILDGTWEPETPTLLPRDDGQCLIYPGRVHSFHGESESGKSLVAQAETARVIAAGQRALYIDFESDAASVVGRLRLLGATAEQIREHLDYRRPDASPFALHELTEWADLLRQPLTLAVIDGVGDALSTFGAAVNANDDVAAWMRRVPRVLAAKTGAAVVLIDHVTKNTDTRGRFAVGAQAKMNGLDGAAYIVTIGTPLGLGLSGTILLSIAKDRPGVIRPHCGEWRKSDHTQDAATITIDSTQPGTTTVTIHAPDRTSPSTRTDATGRPIRLTGLMEKISRIIEAVREPISRTAVMDALRDGGSKAKDTQIIACLNTLTDERYLTETPGPRGSRIFRSANAYRSTNDPDSDTFVPLSEEPT